MQRSRKRIYKTVKFGFLQDQRRIDPVLDDPVNPVIFMPDRNTSDSRFRIHIPGAFVVKNIRAPAVNDIRDLQLMAGAAVNMLHRSYLYF